MKKAKDDKFLLKIFGQCLEFCIRSTKFWLNQMKLFIVRSIKCSPYYAVVKTAHHLIDRSRKCSRLLART